MEMSDSLNSRSHIKHEPAVHIWSFYYHHLLKQSFFNRSGSWLFTSCHPTNNRACDQNRLLSSSFFIYLFIFTCCHQIPQRRERERKKNMWCTNYRELPPLVHKWMMYPERSRGPTCAEIYIVDGLIVPPAAPSLIVMSPSVVMRVSEAAAGSQCV